MVVRRRLVPGAWPRPGGYGLTTLKFAEAAIER